MSDVDIRSELREIRNALSLLDARIEDVLPKLGASGPIHRLRQARAHLGTARSLGELVHLNMFDAPIGGPERDVMVTEPFDRLCHHARLANVLIAVALFGKYPMPEAATA